MLDLPITDEEVHTYRLMGAANRDSAVMQYATTSIRFGQSPEFILEELDYVTDNHQSLKDFSFQVARKELERLREIGARVIFGDELMALQQETNLGRLHRPPIGLILRSQKLGAEPLLDHLKKAKAIVGARAATGYGEHVAMELAAGIVRHGAAVISGGAYGIDGAAHRATLANEGFTVAVLAGGADRLYPSGHSELLQRIVRDGAIITEVPFGLAPTRWRFLERNRLIASLASELIVVEAGRRSGSMNAAHNALTVGTPLFAVPGPITSAASLGSNELLSQGARVCQGVHDLTF